MGLFSRKSSAAKTAPAAAKPQVSADDIWNTPVKKSGAETAFIKESSSDKVHAEKITDTIEPETIRSKMEQLEKELAEKKNKPVKTYADYDVNPVGMTEITDAQTEYEKLYEEEHARFVASHKEDIREAKLEGIDSRLEEMYREHDEKVAQEKRDSGNIEGISADVTAEKLAQLPYAKKPEDYAEYKDIKGISVDESLVDDLGVIDHSGDDDNIGSVSEELLAQKVKEFNEKYGG
ncbi:hypothetical protein [Ruminococcus sp.]|uniref:hypothetical protein n=1 Tax=Ruminococcus sp. TaxID=41978 RepID=UPI0025D5E80C|nr:hypothetical protein [Ruminococcus sp.]